MSLARRLIPLVLILLSPSLSAQAHDHGAMPGGAPGGAMPQGTMLSAGHAGHQGHAAHTLAYGPAVAVGQGVARTYLMLDPAQPGAPVEIGVALKGRALEGLPAEGITIFHLPLPEGAPRPYDHVMMDWNAAGHEPPGIFDLPHFDFHFYLVSEGEVRGGDRASAAIPAIGVHWLDDRSPEIQPLMGNEAGPARYPEPGWYPNAYAITYDAATDEHRIALTGLSWSE